MIIFVDKNIAKSIVIYSINRLSIWDNFFSKKKACTTHKFKKNSLNNEVAFWHENRHIVRISLKEE